MDSIAVHGLPSCLSDARRLAARLAVPIREIDLHRFPDDELRVTTKPAARTTIIYATLDRPNDKLVSILLACDAFRRDGAERIVLVAPYLCYMRQDAAFHAGEAISQAVIGRLLSTVADRVVTVNAHLHRTTDIGMVFPRIDADNLTALPAIAEFLLQSSLDPDIVVVGPDQESGPWVADLADRLKRNYAVGTKHRHSDQSVAIDFAKPAMFAGRPVLLLDDIVSSGGTLIACAGALREGGARSIDAVITHALFEAKLTDKFLKAGIHSIRSTNSISHPTNAVLLDAVIANALRAEVAHAALGRNS